MHFGAVHRVQGVGVKVLIKEIIKIIYIMIIGGTSLGFCQLLSYKIYYFVVIYISYSQKMFVHFLLGLSVYWS